MTVYLPLILFNNSLTAFSSSTERRNENIFFLFSLYEPIVPFGLPAPSLLPPLPDNVSVLFSSVYLKSF